MRNYKLVIAYDGTHYGGWQIQPNKVTIQQVLEEKLQILLKNPVKISGSGRTDAGVHALNQVANFHSTEEIDAKQFLRSLNALLPKDIRVRLLEEVPLSFHSRFSASSKEYHYHLTLDSVVMPFDTPYRYQPRGLIDVEQMKKACSHFIGTHDFSSFANSVTEGSAKNNPVRSIEKMSVVEEDGGIRIECKANGFLYKMVRNIVGTLIECGRGKIPPEKIQRLLEVKDRKEAPSAAPPQGLFLVEVNYQ